MQVICPNVAPTKIIPFWKTSSPPPEKKKQSPFCPPWCPAFTTLLLDGLSDVSPPHWSASWPSHPTRNGSEEAADKNKRYPRYYGIKHTITDAAVGSQCESVFRYLWARLCVAPLGYINQERHGLTVYAPRKPELQVTSLRPCVKKKKKWVRLRLYHVISWL